MLMAEREIPMFLVDGLTSSGSIRNRRPAAPDNFSGIYDVGVYFTDPERAPVILEQIRAGEIKHRIQSMDGVDRVYIEERGE